MARFSSEVVAVVTATEWDSAPAETTLRIALYGGMYTDTENLTGPKVHYNGRIKSDVILEKRIGVVFWNEESTIDFGYLDIAVEDQDATILEFAQKVTVATVDIYRGNLNNAAEDELDLVSSSRCSDMGFPDNDTFRLRLESILQGGFDAPINELYYDNTYPQLDGKPYPVAWAFITDPYQLLPTVYVDDVTLLYHVTDVEIVSFESDVYDRGIALVESVPEFVATTYGFELQQNPDGKIMAGQVLLDDPEDPGDYLKGLRRLTRLAMTRAGIWSFANETELVALSTDTNKGEIFPQFFSQDVVKLSDFMDNVFSGIGAYYYVDELSEIRFGRLTAPEDATATYEFNDAIVVSEIGINDDKAPGLATRITHAENPGVYDQDELAGGVSNADRLLMVNNGYTNTTAATVIPFYAKAATRDPINLAMSFSTSVIVGATVTADSTLITADSTDVTADGYAPATTPTTSTALAEMEVARWWTSLYPQRRRFYTFDAVMNEEPFVSQPLPQLGDVLSLQSETAEILETAKNLFIRRLKFNYSENLLTIEGWG